MTTLQIFHSKKQLRNWWARVVDDPQFAEVLLHARSLFIEANPGEMQLAGARNYENIFTLLAEGEPSGNDMPSPGLVHHVEQEPARPQPAPVPKPNPEREQNARTNRSQSKRPK